MRSSTKPHRRDTVLDLHEKQRIRQSYERKLYLIAELQRMGMTEMDDGSTLEDCSLVTLEQVHINEKCRIGMTL